MLHKWLEEWHDTILYLVGVFGLLGFFFSYWAGEYQDRYAELLIQEFLYSVTINGRMTSEQYDNLISQILEINPLYEVEISCVEYELKPIYALLPEEELVRYYMSRNKKEEKRFCDFEPMVKEEKPESLFLQKKNNAELFASAHKSLPLPKEDVVWNIEAVEPVQKVYEGERLLTMCLVTSGEGDFYLEAEPVNAESSGIVYLNLFLGDKEYTVPVQVVCYPRIVRCENGHEVANSEDRLTKSKIIQKEQCPYCEVIPECITCNKKFLQMKTGEMLKKQDIGIMVVYMNGRSEYVTPESSEWQDSYDENYSGIQQVTVRYRGKEECFLVSSENESCLQCGRDCNERCYLDYVEFPYCVKCMSEVEMFSGKVYEEEQMMLSGELKTYLEKKKEKIFKQGAFVRVYLQNRNRYVTLLQGKVKQDGRMAENR